MLYTLALRAARSLMIICKCSIAVYITTSLQHNKHTAPYHNKHTYYASIHQHSTIADHHVSNTNHSTTQYITSVWHTHTIVLWQTHAWYQYVAVP